jgi:outer membrane protein assembly factor BamA
MKKTKQIFLHSAIIIFSCTLTCGRLMAQSMDGEIHLPEEFPVAFVKISQIEVTGNERTKEKIIIRELDFHPLDSLATYERGAASAILFGQKRFSRKDSSELVMRMKYSRENIINTKLFLEVDLYLEQIEGADYKLRIDVNERWYFWAFPIIQLDYPNFNDWLQDPDLHMLTMGLFTSHNNLWGLGHQAAFKGFLGSSQGAGLGYLIPWIGNGQKIGLLLGAAYKKSAVIEYGSLDNERQIIFEQGSMQNYSFLTTLTTRPGLYNYSKVRISANHIQISDSLITLTQDESLASFLPEGQQSVDFVSLYIEYKYDSRNSHTYPLHGNYLKGFVKKIGMGILSHDVDYFYYGVDMHFYQEISERWYTAEMFKFVTSSSENIPYFFKRNLTSTEDFIRGYDYYALRGDEMYYFRSNLKYNFVKPNVMKARKEKHKDSKFRNVPYAFYLNLIADAAYMKDNFYGDYNPQNNKMLLSWGLGVDVVSYYDMVFRFEYVFTNINSHGFFFGFGMPI